MRTPRAGRIETEDYGIRIERHMLNDPFAAAPAAEHNKTGVKAASASSYTHGTDDERFADYHTEEEPLRFSEFPHGGKGCLYRHYHGPARSDRV